MNRTYSLLVLLAVWVSPVLSLAAETGEKNDASEKTVVIGAQAPTFQIADSEGKVIDLAKLVEKGPVLVRLTCGCAGCDKELAYFQSLHAEYQGKGLTSLAVFREPDAKVAEYVKEKKLNMLYAVDSKGESWKVFQTQSMPTNFLISQDGRIVSIATGCDPSGLIANALSKKVANLLDTDVVDLQKTEKK